MVIFQNFKSTYRSIFKPKTLCHDVLYLRKHIGDNQSPNRDNQSPNRDNQSPNCDNQSLNRDNQSPKTPSKNEITIKYDLPSLFQSVPSLPSFPGVRFGPRKNYSKS